MDLHENRNSVKFVTQNTRKKIPDSHASGKRVVQRCLQQRSSSKQRRALLRLAWEQLFKLSHGMPAVHHDKELGNWYGNLSLDSPILPQHPPIVSATTVPSPCSNLPQVPIIDSSSTNRRHRTVRIVLRQATTQRLPFCTLPS